MNAQTRLSSKGNGLLQRHLRKILLGVGVLFVIVASPYLMLIGSITYDGLSEWQSRVPFDSERWKASLTQNDGDSIRLRMVDDLLKKHELREMTRAQIVSLLGTPPPTEYFRDYQFVYWLGPERGFISIDSEWLAIRYDNDGKVLEARIVRD